MKKILVPTDFSEHAENALLVASQIAKKTNAKILAVHMMDLSHGILNKSSNQGSMEGLFHLQLAEKNFKKLIDKEHLTDVDLEHKVQNEKTFNELNDLAKEENVDLIVMGSHGTSGFTEDVFVGSNTEKMVRNSDVPVLVIKEKMPNFQMNEVVFACDFKNENAEAYKKAIKLFKEFGANVHMLYVNTPSKFMSTYEIEEQVDTFLNNVNGINEVVSYNDYSVENGVFNYTNKIGADIIAIPTHGRRGLVHFLTGSIGEDIANHAKKPVITFKI